MQNADMGSARPVPQQRIIEKMDEYMSRRDYAGAERHLLYWLEEALLGRDLRGQLMLRNELVGHYRKTGERDKAFESAAAALGLLEEMDFGGSISAGTTCVNCATMYSSFGDDVRALELFRRAREIYEGHPATEPRLLGGLYNNMALSCAALGRYGEAHALYDLAMEEMAQAPAGELEQAVTCLNRADAVAAELGMEAAEERVNALLDQAEALLGAEGIPHDGYYAFVCEKCAPSFAYYGYFLQAQRLAGEAKAIYERA